MVTLDTGACFHSPPLLNRAFPNHRGYLHGEDDKRGGVPVATITPEEAIDSTGRQKWPSRDPEVGI